MNEVINHQININKINNRSLKEVTLKQLNSKTSKKFNNYIII